MLSRSLNRRSPKIGISSAALASAEARLMNASTTPSNTSTSTIGSTSFTKAGQVASASAFVEKFTSGGTSMLDLGLDFSKMDFKKIAEDTQHAIHRERIKLPTSGQQRDVDATSTAERSPAEHFSKGAATAAARHNNGPRQSHLASGGGLHSSPPIIEKLRDFKLSNNWEGALGFFTAAVGDPNEYRKWHIQHIRVLIDLLSVHGRMTELWKVWRLARATNKLEEVNESAGNNLMFRFGRPALLRAIVEDPQLCSWWIQMVRDCLKLLEGNSITLDPKNEPAVKVALSADEPQTAIKNHLASFDTAQSQRQGDVRRAARESFHRQVMESVHGKEAHQADQTQHAEHSEYSPPPVSDPTDVYTLNEALSHARSIADVDRLLSLAAERSIVANDDTFARRIQRLGLRRKEAFRKQRETWVQAPTEPSPSPEEQQTSETASHQTSQQNPHPDRRDEHSALDAEILAEAKLLFHQANIHAHRDLIKLFDPLITDTSSLNPEELLGMGITPREEGSVATSEPLPSTSLCNALLYELRKSNAFDDLRLLEALMRGPEALSPQQGKFWRISPSGKTVDHLISAYYRAGHTERCKELFDEMKVNYAARLSPLVYTTMIKIQSAETAPRRDANGTLVFPERPAAHGLSPRMQAINAHQEMNQLIHQLAADGADTKLNDSANIALINKWAQTRRRR